MGRLTIIVLYTCLLSFNSSFAQLYIHSPSIAKNYDVPRFQFWLSKSREWKVPMVSFSCEGFDCAQTTGYSDSNILPVGYLRKYTTEKEFEIKIFNKEAKELLENKFLGISPLSSPRKILKRNYDPEVLKYSIKSSPGRIIIRRFSTWGGTFNSKKPYNEKEISKIAVEAKSKNIKGKLLNEPFTYEVSPINYFDHQKIFNVSFPFIVLEIKVLNSKTGLLEDDLKITTLDSEGLLLSENLSDLVNAPALSNPYSATFRQIVNKSNHPLKDFVSGPDYSMHIYPIAHLNRKPHYKENAEKEGVYYYFLRPNPNSKVIDLNLLFEKNGYDDFSNLFRIEIQPTDHRSSVRQIERFEIYLHQDSRETKVFKRGKDMKLKPQIKQLITNNSNRKITERDLEEIKSQIQSGKIPVVFQGIFTEPFADLYLTEENLIFINDIGNLQVYKLKNKFNQSIPYQIIELEGSILQLTITKEPTGDGMSDRIFPYSIRFNNLIGAGDKKLLNSFSDSLSNIHRKENLTGTVTNWEFFDKVKSAQVPTKFFALGNMPWSIWILNERDLLFLDLFENLKTYQYSGTIKKNGNSKITFGDYTVIIENKSTGYYAGNDAGADTYYLPYSVNILPNQKDKREFEKYGLKYDVGAGDFEFKPFDQWDSFYSKTPYEKLSTASVKSQSENTIWEINSKTVKKKLNFFNQD
ncbi:hypothetical protein [Robiginitalea sp. IMCC43444]|uniref:hypothetical protein n=1 Tax=Robiginitalea sp. IMCC43444 TaxID=3459121 RepID=UPI0040434D64